MLSIIKKEMAAYYANMHTRRRVQPDAKPGTEYQKSLKLAGQLWNEMDTYWTQNPSIHPALLRSHLHTRIAESFNPVIFPDYPFFFEMGLRCADSWGMDDEAPAGWFMKRVMEHNRTPLIQYTENRFSRAYIKSQIPPEPSLGVAAVNRFYDHNHSTLGYTKLFGVGINGILEEIRETRKGISIESDQYQYLMAMEEGLLAILLVAERFACKAEEMLQIATTEHQRSNLQKIAKTARRIPAQPPQSFYEGLCMSLFLKETIATIENIGLSSFGHLDRILGGLYKQDIEKGVITKEEAEELVAMWLIYTDVRFDLDHNVWPETSTCIQLGGCDENGETVYNEVTHLFIETHTKLGLVNPKLNCRISQHSPEEYLRCISKAMLLGNNNFALSNDDVLIPALVTSGVDERDARLYVNGGCQETMIEGVGHTEGAHTYFCLPRIFQLFLQPESGSEEFVPPMAGKYETYEEFYTDFLKSFDGTISLFLDEKNLRYYHMKDAVIAPVMSSTQEGCIHSGRDYALGGAKYNFATLCLAGIGTLADSLYAIQKLVYEDKEITLPELLTALDNNWEGSEVLRKTVLAFPKYGENNPQPDGVAKRVVHDINHIISQKKNPKGGKFLASMFVYYYYQRFAPYLRATPDGRKEGDLFSAGIAPSQLVEIRNPIAPALTTGNVEYSILGGGNAVLDVRLPVSPDLTAEKLAAYFRSCAMCAVPTLQPNVLSADALRAAQIEPEKYRNIIVRICGLSAYFVNLAPDIQEEIIKRNTTRI